MPSLLRNLSQSTKHDSVIGYETIPEHERLLMKQGIFRHDIERYEEKVLRPQLRRNRNVTNHSR